MAGLRAPPYPASHPQETPRRALHVAQVIQLARDYGAEGPRGAYPERSVAPKPRPAAAQRAARAVAVAAGLGLGAAAAVAVKARS